MQFIGSEIYQDIVKGFQGLTSKFTHSKINRLISSQWNAWENISTGGFISTRRLDIDCSGVGRWTRKSLARNMDNDISFEKIITTRQHFYKKNDSCGGAPTVTCKLRSNGLLEERSDRCQFWTHPYLRWYQTGWISGHSVGHLHGKGRIMMIVILKVLSLNTSQNMFPLTSWEAAFCLIPHNTLNDMPTLIQVMAIVFRQQAITWANVDPDVSCHMASLGSNE